MDAEALLLGRVTYDGFSAAWPGRGGEFADKMNTMPKYVVSTTLEPGVEQLDLMRDVSEVAGLKEQEGGPILVAGSRTLVHGLMEHGLVDELRLMIFPLVLGSGGRLFPETPDKTKLELVDTPGVLRLRRRGAHLRVSERATPATAAGRCHWISASSSGGEPRRSHDPSSRRRTMPVSWTLCSAVVTEARRQPTSWPSSSCDIRRRRLIPSGVTRPQRSARCQKSTNSRGLNQVRAAEGPGGRTCGACAGWHVLGAPPSPAARRQACGRRDRRGPRAAMGASTCQSTR